MTILDSTGAPIESKKPKMSRAERRRFARDPLSRHKAIAGAEGVPEMYRLISYGQMIVYEMSEIQMRMAGLGMTPKRDRMRRQEEFTNRWNELVEKLEEVQKAVAEIEEEEKKKEEAAKTTEQPSPTQA